MKFFLLQSLRLACASHLPLHKGGSLPPDSMEKEYEQIVRTPFAFRQVNLLYGRHPLASAFLFCYALEWKRNGTVSEHSVRYPARENGQSRFLFLATFLAPLSTGFCINRRLLCRNRRPRRSIWHRLYNFLF